MQKAISRVIREIHSPDVVTRNKYVGWLGLLLEKSKISANDHSNAAYEGLLPSDLLSLELDDEELFALIRSLVDAISSDIMTVGMIWAFGKAKRSIAFQPFLNVLKTQGHKFNSEANWQSLVSLDNLLKRFGTTKELEQQNTLIRMYTIEDWLHQIETSSEIKSQKMISWLQEKIQDSYNFKYADQNDE